MIARAEGPERIAPEWWRNAAGRDAERATITAWRIAQGRRFWVFRDGLYESETARAALVPAWAVRMSAPFAELVAATNFSFLRGASHPSDMVLTALLLGHGGIGIADRNSVAGVVRAYAALKELREKLRDPPAGEDAALLAQLDCRAASDSFKLVVGARLVFADGTPDIVAYPQNRNGWGRLSRLLTTGNRRAKKGECHLYSRRSCAEPRAICC